MSYESRTLAVLFVKNLDRVATFDTRYVLVDLEFETLAEAEAAHNALRQLWGRVEGKLIESPRARIFEVAESKDL